MLLVSSRKDRYAARLVLGALQRTFTRGQVQARRAESVDKLDSCSVLVQPGDELLPLINRQLSSGGKLMLLGECGPGVAERVGLQRTATHSLVAKEAVADVPQQSPEQRPLTPADESPLGLHYRNGASLATACPSRRRRFCRFDFFNEWNNLGYGRITLDNSCWSLAGAWSAERATPLCVVSHHERDTELAYATLLDEPFGSVLWWNRPVGPIDSGAEWAIVEAFFSDYRAEHLPTLPRLVDVPGDCQVAVVPRLDCDQAVASARPVVELYASRGLPLSLAIQSNLEFTADDISLMQDVVNHGGTLTVHSHTHAPDWGGTSQAAEREYSTAREVIESLIPSAKPVVDAASPFHMNSRAAAVGLRSGGCRGFIGGAIAHHPEALLARSGSYPLLRGVLTASHQCMLHGDCVARNPNARALYAEHFETCRHARQQFGYLDHPLSSSYQYGWSDVTDQVTAHRQLIDAVSATVDVRWLNVRQLFDFIQRKESLQLGSDENDELVVLRQPRPGAIRVGVHWKGRQIAEF